MEVLDAIKERRSIRIYKKEVIGGEIIQDLLEISVLAPSAHNKQPWRFVVLKNAPKKEFVELLYKVFKKLKKAGINTGSFKRSIGCIRRAPVFMLVFNNTSRYSYCKEKNDEVYEWMLDVQSIGGIIQTMLLAAHEKGLGTLWTCEILYADKEICRWLDRNDELIAGICLGYADESPNARKRMSWEEVTKWME